jgi:hypothetical protein
LYTVQSIIDWMYVYVLFCSYTRLMTIRKEKSS